MGTENIVETTQQVAEVAKEASGLGKYNKFGWGFLAGAGAVGTIVGGIFGGIKLKEVLDAKAEKKKATKKRKPAAKKSKAKADPEPEDVDFEEIPPEEEDEE